MSGTAPTPHPGVRRFAGLLRVPGDASREIPDEWERAVFVGLGSNLGDRLNILCRAVHELAAVSDVAVNASSPVYETAPVGGPADQPAFLNAVVRLATRLPPSALLNTLHRIEAKFGRTRDIPQGPRTLDLDLLLYGSRIVQSEDLRIPHPRMWERGFVLVPLADLVDVQELRSRIGNG